MDVEHILSTLSQQGADYILIGGTNFQINHGGPPTNDVDILIRDTPENRRELNFALQELDCEWGPDPAEFKPVPIDPRWLETQDVVCLKSPYGDLDIFRAVTGLDDGFDAILARAELRSMQDGEMYFSLGDEDMLRYELGQPEAARKNERIEKLKSAIEKKKQDER